MRSGGPGGQNVNKVASRAVLRWQASASPSLPTGVKDRFLTQQRSRLTTAGELILTSQRFRDQERNKQDCLDKLRAMIRQALVPPRPRRPTRPGRAARERRLEAKRRRSATKSRRQRLPED